MLADTAIAAYRNFLRIQGWIGSVCLVVERELFGQEPVSEANGATVGERIEREMHQFEHSLMPLLDRAHRVLVRSLDRLEARRSGRTQGQLSIGHAGQVNWQVRCGMVEDERQASFLPEPQSARPEAEHECGNVDLAAAASHDAARRCGIGT